MTTRMDASPVRRFARAVSAIRFLLVASLILLAFAISAEPLVKPPPPPSAASIDRARELLKQIAGGDNVAGTRHVIVITQAELDGLSALVSEATAPVRVAMRLERPLLPEQRQPYPKADQEKLKVRRTDLPAGQWVVLFSRELPLGAWLNVEARATSIPGSKRLPVVQLKIGRLPVPAWITRMVMRRIWTALQGGTDNPQTLDEAFPFTSIDSKWMQIIFIHPGREAAFAGLSRFGGVDPDPHWVARAYCALTRHSDPDLATVMRRAWQLPRPLRLAADEQNRALLIAVAMRSVPEYRDRLAGDALSLVSRCINPPQPVITLAGRNDLAKHFAMSAALSASLGGQMAQSIGVWKELSDSLSGGSGFSFVDIAADRSGERFAGAAVHPQLARFVQTRLAAVTEPQLLAQEALSKPEGLDARMFEQIYHNTDSPEYRSAVAAIDVMLDNIGVPKPQR